MSATGNGNPSARRVTATLMVTFAGSLCWGLFLVYLSPGSDQSDEAFGRLLFKVCLAATALSLGTLARRPLFRNVWLGLTALVGLGIPMALIMAR